MSVAGGGSDTECFSKRSWGSSEAFESSYQKPVVITVEETHLREASCSQGPR